MLFLASERQIFDWFRTPHLIGKFEKIVSRTGRSSYFLSESACSKMPCLLGYKVGSSPEAN